MFILLDLNFTLVGNSLSTGSRKVPYTVQIERETYRPALIELLRSHTVLLVTIRGAQYQARTLERILEQTGWQPHRAYFAPHPMDPTVWKEQALTRQIFPEFGSDPAKYIAVESNENNQKMYARYGILGMKIWGGQHRNADEPAQTSMFD